MRPCSLTESSPSHIAFSHGCQRRRRHPFGGPFPPIHPGAFAVKGSDACPAAEGHSGPCPSAEEQSTDGSPCKLLSLHVQSDSR